MKNNLEKSLKEKAFEYGKKQIEEGTFSTPRANSNFKKIIDEFQIKEESKIFERISEAYISGQRFAIQSKFKEAQKGLSQEIIDKYGNSIDYDYKEDEFENYREFEYKLDLISKIEEIEKVKSNIKVLVFWSESSVFKENQVMSIEQFKTDCDCALHKLRHQQLYGYDKTKYMLIFDNGKGEAVTTNAIRYDIGDYEDFETYLNKGFNNKNIPREVQKYLGLDVLTEDEEEEEQ
ncbi:MAG: hypothetical protein J6J60_00750 [Clostridia bacterium]|nr:hypothetical protein [Clostridia bacterium]